MKKIMYIIVLGLTSTIVNSQTSYYVSSSTGDDSNPGTKALPFESLSHANSVATTTGDDIYLLRGDTWHESITLARGGSSSDTAWIRAYGAGDEKPRILGSTTLNNWIADPNHENVWYCPTNVTCPFVLTQNEVFFTELDGTLTWGTHVYRTDGDWSTVSNDSSIIIPNDCTEEYECTWYGTPASWYSGVGNIYIYSEADPNEAYLEINVAQRFNVFALNNQEYIGFDSLFVGFAAQQLFDESYGSGGNDGFYVYNCEICGVGIKDGPDDYGIENSHSNAHFAYNYIHHIGRRSISLVMYNTAPVRRQENVLIEHNILGPGYHTTGVDCNIDGAAHTITGITIRYNVIQGDSTQILDDENTAPDEGDPRSMGIFLADQSTDNLAYVGDIDIYGNIFKWMTSRAITMENVSNVRIRHNTFYKFNKTLSGYRMMLFLTQQYTDSIYIHNNIIVTNQWQNTVGNGTLSALRLDDTYHDDIVGDFDGNLYYSQDNTDIMITNEYSGMGNYDYTELSDWYSYSGMDENSQVGNPKFNNTDDGDFSLLSSSPAVGSGVTLSYPLYDMNGIPYGSPPTVGALAYSSPDSSYTYYSSFTIPSQVSSTIDTLNRTISVVMPFGTDRSSLTPTLTVVNGTSNPLSGVAQNFTSSVTYTATALDESTTFAYTVTVTNAAASTGTDILTFTIPSQVSSVVNATAHTVTVTMPYGTDVTSLSASATYSTGATSDLTSPDDYTSPVTVTVTAQDGTTTQEWTVTVTVQSQPSPSSTKHLNVTGSPISFGGNILKL